jgi:hypothetical protein
MSSALCSLHLHLHKVIDTGFPHSNQWGDLLALPKRALCCSWRCGGMRRGARCHGWCLAIAGPDAAARSGHRLRMVVVRSATLGTSMSAGDLCHYRFAHRRRCGGVLTSSGSIRASDSLPFKSVVSSMLGSRGYLWEMILHQRKSPVET